MIGLSVSGLLSIGLSATRKRRLRERVTKGLAEAAEGIADEMREAAPMRSGKLRDSVRVEQDPKRIRVVIKAGDEPETERPGAAHEYDEALLVEYGTVRTPAEPFFWPAINAHQDDIESIAAEAVNDAMNED